MHLNFYFLYLIMELRYFVQVQLHLGLSGKWDNSLKLDSYYSFLLHMASPPGNFIVFSNRKQAMRQYHLYL